MSNTTLTFEDLKSFEGVALANMIGEKWFKYHTQRTEVIARWKELRNYIFATDTNTTSNSSLPWKNKTTLPKLCQIRDNLHSNYISALFPNDDWLRWEGYSQEDSLKEKKQAIQSYISNKTRISDFRFVTSQLLYDYIDYGNAFAQVTYENSVSIDNQGNTNINYVGPRLYRISPLDIVFDPVAATFEDSFKIVRSVTTIGALVKRSKERPEDTKLADSLLRRQELVRAIGNKGFENLDKAEGFMMDGFGNYSEYLQSQVVEVLDFYGDLYNIDTNELYENRHIRVIDRMFTIVEEQIDSWTGTAPIFHVGWRLRQDNLWAMGPLENLVGMQYRIDHLENSKADAYDLAIHPPLKIKGDVESFVWGPGTEIHLDENGEVEEVLRNIQWVIAADNQIEVLEQKMEIYAGAPKEAMGVRSPGEKTAFEIQKLENAAGRIFQEKVSTFEVQLLERVLNSMLETAKRNMNAEDVVRVMDDDLGVEKFVKINKEDITASGKLRPIGARHFAAKAQLVQNLTGLANSTVWQDVKPHMSSRNLATLVEELLGLERFKLFAPERGVMEAQNVQRAVNQASEDLQMEQTQEPFA